MLNDVVSVGDADQWGSAAKSGSAAIFVATSENTTPVKVDAAITDIAAALATVWEASPATGEDRIK